MTFFLNVRAPVMNNQVSPLCISVTIDTTCMPGKRQACIVSRLITCMGFGHVGVPRSNRCNSKSSINSNRCHQQTAGA